jgi:hypothetical protein
MRSAVQLLISSTLIVVLAGGCSPATKVGTERGKTSSGVEKRNQPMSGDDQADDLVRDFPIDEVPDTWSGLAGGPAARLGALRETLLRYDGTFIKGWSLVLQDEDAPAGELHGALVELMSAITGPAGLWRETIPNKWLGCGSNPDLPPCEAFREAATHFAKWDRFQKKLDHAPANPTRFLSKSHGKIQAYVETYVPGGRSFSKARETPFFQEHLEEALGAAVDLDSL